MSVHPDDAEERVLILAPIGRDSAVAQGLLSEAGLRASSVMGLQEIVDGIERGIGCAVITQEAILTVDLRPLFNALAHQPAWSDLPIIVITERGGGPERNPGAIRLMDTLGNVAFLERPFHPSTLVSVVQSALRSRRRQYQARAQLVELQKRETALRDSETRFRALAETLEQQVAERTARLRTIFETSHHAQALLAVDGTLLAANKTSLALIGCTLEDVAGKPYWNSPWFGSTPGLSAEIQRAVNAAAKGESSHQEIAMELLDGLHHFEFSVRPVRGDQGEVVGIVPEALDITAKRRAEETLRQAQKMEAIGQLTGGIAHDFNNMLQSIAGGVELMRKRIKEGRSAEAERYIDAAQQSIERASALTHRLLAFSRRQPLAPKTVELDGLIRGMRDLIKQTVGPSVNVVLDMCDEAWAVNCDPNQLENALLNLAINARDAMLPGGGEFIIRTQHVWLDQSSLSGWESAHAGEFMKVSLIDTGSGMPADVLKHVFEPFFTTKPVGQGTGLGLSQVFGFVSQSNGMMDIESTEGAGTMVHIFLPRAYDKPEQRKISMTEKKESRYLAGLTVLLVEDEAQIRDLAVEILQDIGCNVIEACDGSSALHVLRAQSKKSGIDMLITDVGLPGGLNGRQLADAARELYPAVPVLLITGYAGEALGKGIAQDNRMELLTKPFTLDALASRVETMLLPN